MGCQAHLAFAYAASTLASEPSPHAPLTQSCQLCINGSQKSISQRGQLRLQKEQAGTESWFSHCFCLAPKFMLLSHESPSLWSLLVRQNRATWRPIHSLAEAVHGHSATSCPHLILGFPVSRSQDNSRISWRVGVRDSGKT